jgi:phage baseplate assembly protein W
VANDNHLLTDIELRLRRSELRPVYEVISNKYRVPGKQGRFSDIGHTSGRDNLAQAVIMRLLTPRGELAALGHPGYGSRLHEIIGMQNTETKRNLIKLYILESLKSEPRIEKCVDVVVEPGEPMKDRVNVTLTVTPKNEKVPLPIGPFTLEM